MSRTQVAFVANNESTTIQQHTSIYNNNMGNCIFFFFFVLKMVLIHVFGLNRIGLEIDVNLNG